MSAPGERQFESEGIAMELEGKSRDYPGINRADQLMRNYFRNSIELVKYWGPVQMCVFYLE